MVLTTFRLLRLPYVAIKVVFDHFDPLELFIFSFCSQKTKVLVESTKCAPKNVKIELVARPPDDLNVEYNGKKKDLVQVYSKSQLPKNETLPIGKIGSFNVPMQIGRSQILCTYWDDRFIGLKEVTKYLMNIFKKPISSLLTGVRKQSDDPNFVMDWIMSFQNSLDSCYFSTNRVLEEHELSHFLANCKVTQRLSILAKSPDGFVYNPVRPFEMDFLYITPSNWVTRDHLLTMNCKFVVLWESGLSSQDINDFLKHWRNGGCQNLKELQVRMTDIDVDYEVVLDGLEVDIKDVNTVRQYKNSDGHVFSIQGGLDIQRGGTTATVLRDHSESNELLLVVWPDFAGNMF